jgi:hypothetical protein
MKTLTTKSRFLVIEQDTFSQKSTTNVTTTMTSRNGTATLITQRRRWRALRLACTGAASLEVVALQQGVGSSSRLLNLRQAHRVTVVLIKCIPHHRDGKRTMSRPNWNNERNMSGTRASIELARKERRSESVVTARRIRFQRRRPRQYPCKTS